MIKDKFLIVVSWLAMFAGLFAGGFLVMFLWFACSLFVRNVVCSEESGRWMQKEIMQNSRFRMIYMLYLLLVASVIAIKSNFFLKDVSGGIFGLFIVFPVVLNELFLDASYVLGKNKRVSRS